MQQPGAAKGPSEPEFERLPVPAVEEASPEGEHSPVETGEALVPNPQVLPAEADDVDASDLFGGETEDKNTVAASGAQAQASSETVDQANPAKTFWTGFWLTIIVSVGLLAVALINPPADPSERGDFARVLLFLASPGLCVAGLGLYLMQKEKRWVSLKLNRSDYLYTFVQLLPGTAIAALGNMVPNESPFWAPFKDWGGWLSLAFGVLVSVLLLPKFERRPGYKPNPPATSPGSE